MHHSWFSVFNKCSPNSDYTIHTSVYRKQTNTDLLLGFELEPSNFSQKSSHPGHEILPKEMDLLHRVLLKNNYPDGIIKDYEKISTSPTVNSYTGLEVNRNIFISVLLFLALVRNSEESFHIPVNKLYAKEPTPLNPSLCTP